MRKIPVISRDAALRESIARGCAQVSEDFSPVFYDSREDILAFLNYEFPEVKVFSFADSPELCKEVLAEARADPWLHYGGIIAIHDSSDEKGLFEELSDDNIIAVLRRGEVESAFPRLLRIIQRNKRILFQRGIQKNLIQDISCALTMDNDPLDITAYANLLTNYLYNAGLIGKDDKERLHVALLELLINAIEHGNCRIGYGEKSAWLERGNDMMDLIREKNADPAVRRRKVRLSYSISPERSRFSIQDEGEGFDWRAVLAAKPAAPELHGLGVKMANIYVQKLEYNDRGNEVSFEVRHQRVAANSVPKIFARAEEIRFEDGAVVCQEGEETDYLYYIVSGLLRVLSKGKHISTLSPDDMFMGEMSFLLSNRRTATVVAEGPAVLIRISKRDFVTLIKENPHYGIFLAQLLAQRLERRNAME